MKKPGSTNLDKVFHDLFAATLREPYNSHRDEVPTSKKLKYADRVAAIAKKLSEPKTTKLNLLKALKVRKLPEVETNFLKAAIPILTCVARPYNSSYVSDVGTAIINKWAGIGDDDSATDAEVTELLISPQAFKNCLMKLLLGNSDDPRVTDMRNQVKDEEWQNVEETDETPEDDEAECTFKPKLTGYPAYLKKAPRKLQPKYTVTGQFSRLLEMPQAAYDSEDEDCATEEYRKPDYSSPSNNICPLTMGLQYSQEKETIPFPRPVSVREILNDAKMHRVTEEPCSRSSQIHRHSGFRNVQNPVGGREHAIGRNNPAGPFSDEYIEDMLNSLPGIDELLPVNRPRKTRISYVNPRRNQMSSEMFSVPHQEDGRSWKNELRGGYLRNPMRFSIDSHPKHGIEQSCNGYVGSLKNCDYVFPSEVAKPVFTRQSPFASYDNGMHNKHQRYVPSSGNPLDLLEAELSTPVTNIMKLRC